MSASFWRGGWLFSSLVAVSTALVILCFTSAAGAQNQEQSIQAHIQAGEFAPAAAIARQVADPRRRDAFLGQIAQAQAGAGARDASFLSASQIADDRTRAGVLSRLAAVPPGGQGGGQQADFQSLIDLITSTVQPTTWDTVGGPGSVAEFPTGVWVDPQGLLRPLMKEAGRDLAALRTASAPSAMARQDDARRESPLRMVSLPRLEKQVQLRLAAGRPLTETMNALAGLYRIRYVFLYPESGDIVLAGPAGDWNVGSEGQLAHADGGQPVVRLDDVVVVLRHMAGGPDAKFGCMITPRQEGLARLKEFVEQSNRRPINADFRNAWLAQLRSRLGRQDIEVYGLDPRTRAARVMVEADYRMKLVGMGLEEGVPGVESYLKLVKLGPAGQTPPMGVLRWWFTLNYEAILASKQRTAFAIRGQGVKVESENERLTAEGKRVHTGQSEDLNREFARSFTEHFDDLCRKYPIYAELRNLFDLALVGALVREEAAGDKVGWHMTCFADPQGYPVETGDAPKEVESVVNCRVIGGKHIIAGVSGGVRCQPASLVKRQAIETETYPALQNQRAGKLPKSSLRDDAWWWD